MVIMVTSPFAALDMTRTQVRKIFPDVKTLPRNNMCLTYAMKGPPYSFAKDSCTNMDGMKINSIVVRMFDASLEREFGLSLKICESRESAGNVSFCFCFF